MIEKSVKVKKCPECGKSDLILDYEAGELVCEQCGFVISSTLFDHGPEWRAFNAEQREKRTRVGAPLTWTIHDRGLARATRLATASFSIVLASLISSLPLSLNSS